MRISSVSFHEIGPFCEAELQFPLIKPGTTGELILFEGPNGCGKTTVAQSIAWAATILAQMASNGFARNIGVQGPAFFGEFQLRYRSPDSQANITLEHGQSKISIDTRTLIANLGAPVDGALAACLASAGNRPLSNVLWGAHYFQANIQTPTPVTEGPKSLGEPDLFTTLPFNSPNAEIHLGQVLVNFDYERVRASHYSREKNRGSEERQRLEKTEQKYDEAINRIISALSAILQRKIDVKFEPGVASPAILFDGEKVPLKALGEGLRSTFAWMTALLIRLERTPWAKTDITPLEQEFWLVLDEVDVYLHPQMQLQLFPILRSLFPNARIYATTHSPFAVAGAGEGYVFSMERNPRARPATIRVPAQQITPGTSLEWVIEEIFRTPSLFLNQKTRNSLSEHDLAVQALRSGHDVNWVSFLANRRQLIDLGPEVQAIVTMREVPVRRVIEQAQKDCEGVA